MCQSVWPCKFENQDFIRSSSLNHKDQDILKSDPSENRGSTPTGCSAFLIRDDGAGHLWAGVCVVEDREDLEAP